MSAALPDSPLLALSLQAAVLSQPRAREACAAFVGELAASRACSRASVGFTHNGFMELAAVSGGGNEGMAGRTFAGVAAAMDEAALQGISVFMPAEGPLAIRIAHSRLLVAGGAVVTVPLVYLGEVVGAVTCEWHACPAGFERLVTGPVLYLLQQRHAPWHRRAALALRQWLRRVAAPEGRAMRLLIAAVIAAMLLVLVMPVDHRVGGHARIEGEQQRAVVVPADGFLKAVHARPGDRVNAGQLLVELADQDLLLQRRKWTSDLGMQENAYASAVSRADRAAMVIALARADEARAHLGLVESELARTRIAAPFTGVVVDGDLSQVLGAPLERGKLLMLLAPLQRYRVMVQVDERDIASVHVGQRGKLSLSALPWDEFALRVTRIAPLARAVEGRNVFEVQADVSADAARMLPGLEGVARLDVGRKPLAWVWLHRFAAWVRLTAWSLA